MLPSGSDPGLDSSLTDDSRFYSGRLTLIDVDTLSMGVAPVSLDSQVASDCRFPLQSPNVDLKVAFYPNR
jgi:hypothetical protein